VQTFRHGLLDLRVRELIGERLHPEKRPLAQHIRSGSLGVVIAALCLGNLKSPNRQEVA
jgi:hypothetical protein